MKDFIKRIRFWIEWSYYLRCKHCCLWCKYYDDCVNEIHDLERRLEINNFFD